jgi:rubrerythrin
MDARARTLEELMRLTDLTLHKALELATTIEDRAAQRYEALARKFADDESLGGVFAQLAKDEAAHGSHFADLMRGLPDESALEDKEDALNLLRASAASKALDPDHLSRTDEIRSPTDALHQALDLERATLFFYQSLKDVLDNSPEIDHLIDTEKRHVSTLMKVLVTDARFRGIDDTW